MIECHPATVDVSDHLSFFLHLHIEFQLSVEHNCLSKKGAIPFDLQLLLLLVYLLIPIDIVLLLFIAVTFPPLQNSNECTVSYSIFHFPLKHSCWVVFVWVCVLVSGLLVHAQIAPSEHIKTILTEQVNVWFQMLMHLNSTSSTELICFANYSVILLYTLVLLSLVYSISTEIRWRKRAFLIKSETMDDKQWGGKWMYNRNPVGIVVWPWLLCAWKLSRMEWRS